MYFLVGRKKIRVIIATVLNKDHRNHSGRLNSTDYKTYNEIEIKACEMCDR